MPRSVRALAFDLKRRSGEPVRRMLQRLGMIATGRMR
jgi:hypothetical protein